MRRGEVWLVEYDRPAPAGEPAKRRPAVVVSADRFNASRALTVVAVPLTSRHRGNPLHVEVDLPDLDDVSYAQPELVGVVSKRRLVGPIGRLGQPTLDELEDRLAMLLEL